MRLCIQLCFLLHNFWYYTGVNIPKDMDNPWEIKKHEMSYIYAGFSRNLSSKQVAGQCSDMFRYTHHRQRVIPILYPLVNVYITMENHNF